MKQETEGGGGTQEKSQHACGVPVCVQCMCVRCMCVHAYACVCTGGVPWPWHLQLSIAPFSQESWGRERKLTGDSAIPVIPDAITARTLARKPGRGSQRGGEIVQRQLSK